MSAQARHQEIIQRLKDASAAHFEYETNELRGVYDQQWAEWYARYLIDHAWNELFERVWTLPELVHALRQADAAYRANEPEQHWQEFYAEQFIL